MGDSQLLEKYNLPLEIDYDKKEVFNTICKDKKRKQKNINFVLLKGIGNAVVESISLDELEVMFENLCESC